MVKRSKIKTITLDPSFFISVIDADFYFSVQQAFQALGIFFIDLNNGRVINGNINIDTLGMVSKLPPLNTPKPQGNIVNFLLPAHPPKPITVDVEATLNFYEPKDTIEPYIFTIQVVNQNELEFWYKIVAEVGKEYINLDKFENKFPQAIFRLIPLCLPTEADPASAISAMLGNIQRYRAGDGCDSAISCDYLDGEDGDWDNEEEDQEC